MHCMLLSAILNPQLCDSLENKGVLATVIQILSVQMKDGVLHYCHCSVPGGGQVDVKS
jgi:hypothetical protein